MSDARSVPVFPCQRLSGPHPNTPRPVVHKGDSDPGISDDPPILLAFPTESDLPKAESEVDQVAGSDGLEEPAGFHKEVSWAAQALKRGLDYTFAFVGLIVVAPVMLVVAALVKLTSPGPAFYTQARVGKNGKVFTMYKIRTMVHDAEARTGAVWSQPGDPRTTWLGRMLRDTHLDELPQLLNVLLGHMSLIGPRPERPEIVSFLQTRVEGYADRHAVRPGITGLAQLRLPPDVDIEGVRRKVACDLHYIHNFAIWLDCRILICTALLLAQVPLRISLAMFRLPNPLEETAVPVLAPEPANGQPL